MQGSLPGQPRLSEDPELGDSVEALAVTSSLRTSIYSYL